MQAQILDDMDLEREPAHNQGYAVRMMLQGARRQHLPMNLIDTPGTRLQLRVSPVAGIVRGRAAGWLDASQGVEAQPWPTLIWLSTTGWKIIPGHHKIDLPSAGHCAHPGGYRKGCGADATDAIPVSARPARALTMCWKRSVHRLPAATGDPDAPLQAVDLRLPG